MLKQGPFSFGMVRPWVVIALLFVCGAAARAEVRDSLCFQGEFLFFHCQLKDQKQLLSVCGKRGGKTPYLELRRGRLAEIVYRFPRQRRRALEAFTMVSGRPKPNLRISMLRFRDRRREYVLSLRRQGRVLAAEFQSQTTQSSTPVVSVCEAKTIVVRSFRRLQKALRAASQPSLVARQQKRCWEELAAVCRALYPVGKERRRCLKTRDLRQMWTSPERFARFCQRGVLKTKSAIKACLKRTQQCSCLLGDAKACKDRPRPVASKVWLRDLLLDHRYLAFSGYVSKKLGADGSPQLSYQLLPKGLIKGSGAWSGRWRVNAGKIILRLQRTRLAPGTNPCYKDTLTNTLFLQGIRVFNASLIWVEEIRYFQHRSRHHMARNSKARRRCPDKRGSVTSMKEQKWTNRYLWIEHLSQKRPLNRLNRVLLRGRRLWIRSEKKGHRYLSF